MKETLLSRSYMVAVLAVISVIGLIVGKQILIPVALSLFLSLTLSPLVEWLHKWKVPKTISIIISFLTTFVILGIIGTTIGFAINDFVDKIPTYSQSVGANIAKTKDVIVDIIPFDKELVAKKLSESTNLSSVGINTIKNILSTTTNIGATLGLTLVITFLMLLYRNRIKRFATMITRSENHGHITSIVHRSFSVMPRYMAGILTVVIIMTILNTIGFMIIGTPSPLFWGLMVSLLNVIPYVGPAIGFGAAALFSLLVAGPTVAVLAMIMFLVIQFIDNNLLTPMIAGSQININALAAIISLVVWGMIWGMVGMVLALPILGLIKIICDEIPELHAIGYLIGDKE